MSEARVRTRNSRPYAKMHPNLNGVVMVFSGTRQWFNLTPAAAEELAANLMRTAAFVRVNDVSNPASDPREQVETFEDGSPLIVGPNHLASNQDMRDSDADV